MVEGGLVISRTHRSLGVAKVTRVENGTAHLEWFDSIARPVAWSETVPLEDIIPWTPERQARVYFRTEAWKVGRVVDEEFGRVCVRPPGDAPDIWLGIEDLFVRWDRPLDNPVAVMQAVGMETPLYFRARRPFVASMLKQRAASHGMPALPSSAIEIFDHQVDAVARILRDPVQRYLLADEVGLGKTIEAGIVIRQRLLDDPEAAVRVVMPKQIRWQWEAELEEKFFVDDFVLSQVALVSLESGEAWTPREGSPLDLLVIDEAHHVAAWAAGPAKSRARFQAAARLAHHARALLLLSATPVAHHEQTFLAMLHLLDPDNYRLEDLDALQRRVRDRHELSRALVLFRPGQRLRRMVANGDRLRNLLGDDELATRLLAAVVESGDDLGQEELDSRVRALRSAITERHRIHHRMVRHRRDDVRDFPVRGRCLAERISREDDIAAEVDTWLLRWTNALVEDGTLGESDRRDALLRILLDRAFAFPRILKAVATSRAGSPHEEAELDGPELDELQAHPVGPAEAEVLRAIDRLPLGEREARRVQAIIERVDNYPRRTKTVVFATYTATARLLAAALDDRLALGQVSLHLADMSADETRLELRRFREDTACNVLVCDATAEEGLNLQFADVLIHTEVPLSPNRLEQRIGRLDRYGKSSPIQNVVVCDPIGEPTLSNAWLQCLEHGFGVFERSIAAYQFVVDSVMPRVFLQLLEGSSVGLADLIHDLPRQLEAERQELREQDQLDAIEAVDLRQPVAEAVRALDEDWEEHENAADNLIWKGPGNLRFVRLPDFRNEQELCTFWEADPSRGGEPLVASGDLVRYFLGTLSEYGRELSGSFDRNAALRYPRARVWRIGDRFLDGLFRYVRESDDRGRAYAIWRHANNFSEDATQTALRFDFILEAAMPDDNADDTTRALARRAAEVLPPWFETAWITPDLEELRDPDTIARMAAKFSTMLGDQRLGRDNWDRVAAALPGLDWEKWCRDASDMAAAVVAEREEVRRIVDAARERAGLVSDARLGVLRGRGGVGDVEGLLELEERCGRELQEAVARPRLFLDSVGLVVLAGSPLPGKR